MVLFYLTNIGYLSNFMKFCENRTEISMSFYTGISNTQRVTDIKWNSVQNCSICILVFSSFLLLFKYICLHFSTTTFPYSTHPHLPLSILPQFGFVPGSFIQVPWQAFSFFPWLSPSTLPSGHCQFVLYFNVSVYIFLLVCISTSIWLVQSSA